MQHRLKKSMTGWQPGCKVLGKMFSVNLSMVLFLTRVVVVIVLIIIIVVVVVVIIITGT